MRSFVQQRTVRKRFDVTSTKATQCQPVAYAGMRSPVGGPRLSSLLTSKDSAEARRSVAKSQLSRKVTYYMHRQLIKTETRYALYRHCER